MNLSKSYKRFKGNIIHIILIILVESIFSGITLIGYAMLINSNIVISIVGAIIFLIGLAILTITILAIIIDIYEAIK